MGKRSALATHGKRRGKHAPRVSSFEFTTLPPSACPTSAPRTRRRPSEEALRPCHDLASGTLEQHESKGC